MHSSYALLGWVKVGEEVAFFSFGTELMDKEEREEERVPAKRTKVNNACYELAPQSTSTARA